MALFVFQLQHLREGSKEDIMNEICGVEKMLKTLIKSLENKHLDL